jgi:predicted nucleic acid-binding protein
VVGFSQAWIWTIRPPCFHLWKSSVILPDVNILVYAHREDTPNLAALAIESGSEWITTDRDFSRFPQLSWRHPLDA